MLRIVTDGAGDIPAKWQQEYDVHVIPVNIHFGESSFLQHEELSNEDFYRMVEEKRVIPKTSQPSPQQFITLYRKIAQPGDDILSIHVTSKLSGTYTSAVMAGRELEGEFNVHPFDSAAGSAAMGYMCKEARELDRKGADLNTILKRLEFIRQNITIVLTLNTLEYAKMSGRVKTLQAALASLLNVKPIIELQDGSLNMADRVRTRQRALDFVIEKTKQKVGDRPVNVAVVNARDPQSGEVLMNMARKSLNCQELIMTELSISVAANLGPGTVGVIAYPVNE